MPQTPGLHACPLAACRRRLCVGRAPSGTRAAGTCSCTCSAIPSSPRAGRPFTRRRWRSRSSTSTPRASSTATSRWRPASAPTRVATTLDGPPWAQREATTLDGPPRPQREWLQHSTSSPVPSSSGAHRRWSPRPWPSRPAVTARERPHQPAGPREARRLWPRQEADRRIAGRGARRGHDRRREPRREARADPVNGGHASGDGARDPERREVWCWGRLVGARHPTVRDAPRRLAQCAATTAASAVPRTCAPLFQLAVPPRLKPQPPQSMPRTCGPLPTAQFDL